MYQRFLKIIENANVTIATYDSQELPESQQVCPTQGTVAFGSALFGWAFTLSKFARIYSAKFKVDKKILMEKLWGDNYYDPIAKKWNTSGFDEEGKPLQRGFVKYIMEPIIRLVRNIMEDNKEVVWKICSSLGIVISQEEQQQEGKVLFRTVFMKWLNAADSLLEMIVSKLPSPIKAQSYRAAHLYEGPMDDDCGRAMQACDPNGPLMVYISKMVKTTEKGRFYAFGRVFSGTVRSGQKVRIMGPNYTPGKATDLFVKNVQRVVLMMGSKVEPVGEVPCGSTVGLIGIDKYLVKQGTLSDHSEAHCIKAMKYSVSPVVRVSVSPKYPQDLPKLIEGMRNLAKADPLVQCFTVESTGEHIIAGCGDLHIEICLKELENEHAGIPIVSGDPVVSYRETVSAQSSIVCLAKSANKHNRLYCQASPLSAELTDAIEAKEVDPRSDKKFMAK